MNDYVVSLKIGGVSRDGHGIKLAYYQHTKGSPEAESLASFGN